MLFSFSFSSEGEGVVILPAGYHLLIQFSLFFVAIVVSNLKNSVICQNQEGSWTTHIQLSAQLFQSSCI